MLFQEALVLLCSSHVGLACACNLLDGIDEDILSIDDIEPILEIWRTECTNDKAASTPEDVYNHLIRAMKVSGMTGDFADKIRPLRKPEDIFVSVIGSDRIVNHHIKKDIVFNTLTSVTDNYDFLNQLDYSNDNIFTSAEFGNSGRYFVTTKPEVQEHIHNKDPDSIIAKLAVWVTLKEGERHLSVVSVPSSSVPELHSKRSDVVESNGNTRYRTIPEQGGQKTTGCTVDLEKMVQKKSIWDGPTEQIFKASALNQIKGCEVIHVGKITHNHPGFDNCWDEGFVDKILNGRAKNEIVKELAQKFPNLV